MPRVTNGEHTNNIPAEDLPAFLELGWEEVKEKKESSEEKTEKPKRNKHLK